MRIEAPALPRGGRAFPIEAPALPRGGRVLRIEPPALQRGGPATRIAPPVMVPGRPTVQTLDQRDSKSASSDSKGTTSDGKREARGANRSPIAGARLSIVGPNARRCPSRRHLGPRCPSDVHRAPIVGPIAGFRSRPAVGDGPRPPRAGAGRCQPIHACHATQSVALDAFEWRATARERPASRRLARQGAAPPGLAVRGATPTGGRQRRVRGDLVLALQVVGELFKPLRLRGVTFKHRIFVSPMCQYSAIDGVPTDWHFVHLGTGRSAARPWSWSKPRRSAPEGRISPATPVSGRTAHAEAFTSIAAFIREPRRAARHPARPRWPQGLDRVPWLGPGGKPPASRRPGDARRRAPLPFADYPRPARHAPPRSTTVVGLRWAARRALQAGFEVVELHLRPRLPAARVPLAAVEPAHRPVRRLAREPRSPAAAHRPRGARDLAEREAALRSALRDRLGRRGLGFHGTRSRSPRG